MQEKLDLIIDEGVNVVIKRTVDVFTKAIIGKFKVNTVAFFELENQRKGVFLPTDDVKNGEVIFNEILNEHYISISVYHEVFQGEIISIIALLLKCNTVLQFTPLQQTADTKGNIISVASASLSIKAYNQVINDKLRQMDYGILPDTVYKVYIPANPLIKLNSQLTLNKKKFKVIGIDDISFENIYVVQLAGDVRNL